MPKFSSILLYNQPFSRYKVVQNQQTLKCTEWPQNGIEHLTVISILYTILHPGVKILVGLVYWYVKRPKEQKNLPKI